MRAVVQPLDFAKLQRVQNHAHVAIAREPRPMVLISHLVPVAHAIGNHRAMAAQVKDRRRRSG